MSVATSSSVYNPAVTIVERGGACHKVPISMQLYKDAAAANMSVPDYFRSEYGANADQNYANGDVFKQALASVGLESSLFPKMPLSYIFQDNVRSATTADAQAASRILAPAAVLELVEENPIESHTDELQMFDRMIALDTSITQRNFEYPIFDSSNASKQLDSAIGQLATPVIVGQLKVSEKAYKIPTYSYGLEVSDEAVQALTIDHVATYLRRLKNEMDYTRTCNQITSILNGDVDMDMKPVNVKPVTNFDSTAGNGKLTHKAYVKWLRSARRSCRVDFVICDEETYFSIINREGRPTILTTPVADAEQLAQAARPYKFHLYEPEIFIVDDGLIPTGHLYGLDSTGAIARVTNSAANYEATVDLAMRKGQQMRFDYGAVVYRHSERAWNAMSLY